MLSEHEFNSALNSNHQPNHVHQAHVVTVHHYGLSFGRRLGRDLGLGLVLGIATSAFMHTALIKKPNTFASTSLLQSISVPYAPANDVNLPAVAEKKPPQKASATPTSLDLQKVLDKWRKDYPAGTVSVYVKEIDGSNLSASINSHEQYEAASLYKLFLSQYLYSKIQAGTLSRGDYFGSSRTVGTCLEVMITVSDNECGESIGGYVGWGTLHSFVGSQDFSETSMVNYNRTTAYDIAKFLEKLESGRLVSANHKSELIANMKNQTFDQAIPAGVPNLSVANKTGNKASYWHDGAIVYHPKGTYVLAVMTNGSSTSAISELSKRIASFMNNI